MTFGADWYNGYGERVLLRGYSDFKTGFVVDWGDGSTAEVDKRDNHNENGIRYTHPISHTYSHDGVFDVTMSETTAGLPPIHLQAFLYSQTTDDIRLNTSDLGDIVLAGSGTNRIASGGGNDVVIGGSGNDLMKGGDGDDILDGLDGDNVAKGGTGDDQLLGGEGNDQLVGGPGDDFLTGGGGGNQLSGGKGNDLLYFGAGMDHVSGGAGADIFHSDVGSEIDRDEILDFSGIDGDGDKLDLGEGFYQGAYVPYKFIGHGKFDGSGPELREVQGETALDHIIQGDEYGEGHRSFSFVVHGDVVTADDFVQFALRLSWPEVIHGHLAFADAHQTHHLQIV